MDRRVLDRILESHQAWLESAEGGERANLVGADLRDVDLRGVDLTDADLRNADLSGANLADAVLHRANMDNAVLVRTNLQFADMSEADCSNVDMRLADLTACDLTGTELWRANFKGVVIAPDVLHEVLNCRMPEHGKTFTRRGAAKRRATRRRLEHGPAALPAPDRKDGG